MIAMRWLWMVLVLFACASTPERPAPLTVSTPPTQLRGLVPAYEGPRASLELTLEKTPPRPLWLTGFTVRVLDREGREAPASGLLSGASLQLFSAERHRELHGLKASPSAILFALGPVQSAFRLPKEYGIPLFSNETIVLTSQWMNDEIYRRPGAWTLEAELTFSSEALVAVRPVVLGEGWSWRAAPGESLERFELPQQPLGTVVASWPVAATCCRSLDLLQGESTSLLRALETGSLERISAEPGARLQLLARCNNEEPFAQPAGALLLLYRLTGGDG